jgi:hypothetical protein
MKTKNKIDISRLTEEELLNVRICDLSLTIEGSWVEQCITQVYHELDRKGIRFKPPCYLADEWLTPDNEPVIGIPFFLAHPLLIKLEKKMMLDVEGGTKQWCLQLLRHETGHALNYAYKLYKRRRWQKIFGRFSQEYADTYRFRPYSRSFVRHLEDYYAQYHPDEDFAETFAVWLTPHRDWEREYRGWKALQKLKYVDELMKEIKEREPLVKKGRKYWEASRVRKTLKNYYKGKKYFYAEEFPDFHDTNLKKIFVARSKDNKNNPSAHEVIKKYRRTILGEVSLWTGEKKYIINDLLETISERCRALKLVSLDDESSMVLKIATYITTLIMNYLYTGRFRKEK